MNFADDDEEEVEVLVVQIGSCMTRAGFAGDNIPRTVFPTIVGEPKFYISSLPNILSVGDEAISKRGVLKLSYPIVNGIIMNYEYIEKVFHHVFYKEIKVMPEEHPIMIVEPILNPKANRERLVKMIFEKFDHPACAFQNTAKLTCFSYGKTCGIVLQMGSTYSYTLPIHEGQPIYHAIERINIGGNYVTQYLKTLLKEKCSSLLPSREVEVTRDIKENFCFVALDFEQALLDSAYTNIYNHDYELPNGNTITLGNERFKTTEVLFKPFLHGKVSRGIHEIVLSSLSRCPIDLQHDLISNILLGGGNSMFEGLKTRLIHEICKNSPKYCNKVGCIDDPSSERKFRSWVGGSIIASLSKYQKAWFTKESYDNKGAKGIHDHVDV